MWDDSGIFEGRTVNIFFIQFIMALGIFLQVRQSKNYSRMLKNLLEAC